MLCVFARIFCMILWDVLYSVVVMSGGSDTRFCQLFEWINFLIGWFGLDIDKVMFLQFESVSVDWLDLDWLIWYMQDLVDGLCWTSKADWLWWDSSVTSAVVPGCVLFWLLRYLGLFGTKPWYRCLYTVFRNKNDRCDLRLDWVDDCIGWDGMFTWPSDVDGDRASKPDFLIVCLLTLFVPMIFFMETNDNF